MEGGTSSSSSVKNRSLSNSSDDATFGETPEEGSKRGKAGRKKFTSRKKSKARLPKRQVVQLVRLEEFEPCKVSPGQRQENPLSSRMIKPSPREGMLREMVTF